MGHTIKLCDRWWEDGEKPKRYFHGLENDKAWDKMISGNGEVVFGASHVQKVPVECFSYLYKVEDICDVKYYDTFFNKKIS